MKLSFAPLAVALIVVATSVSAVPVDRNEVVNAVPVEAAPAPAAAESAMAPSLYNLYGWKHASAFLASTVSLESPALVVASNVGAVPVAVCLAKKAKSRIALVSTNNENLRHFNVSKEEVKGRVVVVVDGPDTQFAVKSLQTMSPEKIVVVSPVGPIESCETLAREVDRLIVPLQPRNFQAVGLWYDNFPQVDDTEVIQLLNQSKL
ncbi:hypothetical protein HDU79_011616 [Rhizoclosmatium sp. JEL0117]|nr:hypothetical protein HDU79_011616 [Rhizoclosmatium sp. JEL0117]